MQRYYVMTVRGKDLWPGGFAELENALTFAKMHVACGVKRTALVTDIRGELVSQFGYPPRLRRR